ncbi:MAG: S41 family peptidase [Bacillota bacterium]
MKLVDGALRGAVEALRDPASQYLSAQELNDGLAAARRRAGTLGLELRVVDGTVQVARVAEGGPAASAGLLPGDTLLAVGTAHIGSDLDLAIRILEGEPGTRVDVTVMVGGTGRTVIVSLQRQSAALPVVEGNHIQGVLVIQVRAITSEARSLLLHAIEGLGAEPFILDLRGNEGGNLEVAIALAQDLTGQATVGFELRRDGTRGGLGDASPPTHAVDPGARIVVMVDGRTASAAEFLAAALQDLAGAVVVGQRTLGKGTVQQSFPLANGGLLRLTVSELLRSTGERLHGVGVHPDVPIRISAASVAPVPNLYRPVRLWTVGLDVLALQEWLHKMGYNPGPLDGIFGPRSLAAVMELQDELGLVPRDTIDASWLKAVESLLAARASLPGDRVLEEAVRVALSERP